MASVHLCNIDTNHISATKIAELLEGKRHQANGFKCGRCSKTFTTICVLHYHCMIHCKGGSYFFDHASRTAFPRYDTVCSYTQVETDLLNIELGKDLMEGKRTLTSTAREINSAVVNLIEAQSVSQGGGLYLDVIDKDNKQQVNNIDGGSYLMAELRKENRKNGCESLNMEPINKECVINHSVLNEESSMHKAINQEQVPNYSVVVDAGGYSAGQLSDTDTMEVKIRNISQSEDGMISFDIDEKYSDLFEVAASTILERIQRDGFEWIDGNAVKIKVPVKGGARSNTDKDTCATSKHDDNNKNGNDGILADVGTFAQNLNQRTEKDDSVENTSAALHADVKEYPYIKKAKVTKKKKEEKDNKDSDLDEWLENVLNINNETSASVSEPETKKEVKKNVEIDASSNKSRRSGRRRIVSSRLKDAVWDSPVEQKSLPKDTQRNRTKTRIIEDVKEEVGENEQKNEMHDKLEENIDGSQCNVTDKPHFSVPNSQLSELDLDCDNVEADQTCEADISASEVLLSLSKANKQGSLNRNPTEQQLEFQISKSVNRKRTRSKTSSRSKLSDDAVDSADDTSDWEKPKRSKKSKVPATKRKDHKCETCGKVGSLQMVRYHKQCHSEQKSFFCEVCGKGYKTKACLVAHKRQHDEYKFKCDKCPASFYRKQFLRSHLLTHTGELPHVCDICNKGFRELYILQRHVNNVHKNIRNFLCDICGMRFFRQETRNNHRVRHFEPTIPCRYCPKMFKAELDRRKHELTHTGEKQFFCPKCSNGFTQLWPYYRHMWKKHNIGKEEAKKIKIRNKDIVSMKNIHRPDPESGIIQIVDMKACPDTVVVEHVYEEMESDEYQESATSVVYETKMIQELPEDSVVEYKEPVSIQKEGYVSQSNEEFVTQSGNEIVTQSGNDMVIQSTSQGTPVAADLKAIYDHFYVDGSNIVLSGNQEKRTVVMRTRQEDPETGDISIVQQNFVILSEYPAMDGTPLEIEGYKKIEDYSELDIS